VSRTYDTRARFSLLAHYRETFFHYWKQRHQNPRLLLTEDEAAFSPPAIALEERPISPTLRFTAAVLVTLVTLTLVWSIVARVDIVVNATGKVIPSGWTKTVASVDTASVRAIHVVEGQAVKAGDVLIELDAREHEAEREKATGEEAAALLQVARSRALIAAIDSHRPPRLGSVPEVPAQMLQDAQLHLIGEYLDYTSKLAQLDADIEHYENALPLAVEREKIYENLLQNHDVSTDSWLAKKQDRVDLEGKLVDVRNARLVLITDTKKTAYDALTDASKSAASSEQDAIKEVSHARWLTLRAPVDGTVQQVAVHTIGGVVQAAQPLLQVVPAEKQIEVEAMLQNKDIGFVVEGQQVAVKITAFDYTKYGTIAGRVVTVSHDAIEDKDKGLLYSVKVVLDKPDIRVQGREVALTPGMSVDVDIKTGSRRIIEYVLSPLLRRQHESLHER
jgi:membrane fusion protein, hemolysin D